MSEVLHIDDLEVEVRRSPRRRTVDLIVDRFGEVVINIPESLSQQELESIVRRKQEWIYTKLGQKEIVLRMGESKEYVTGEGFYYLGKKYRLKLLDPRDGEANLPQLRLLNGRFVMPRSAAGNGRNHFIKWYMSQGQGYISKAIDILKERVLAEPRTISIRDLQFRWGSCNSAGDLYFHWRVMLLPPNVIRYLAIHELVHLHEHNHSAAFYQTLRRAAPDYREIENWLEINGDRYAL
ncbi:MAG: SprT family zinc-dependent metalloprotease [Deltaproteobacteria bacterium]|jgi:predicted metal-dependent hydrolase